MTIGTVKTPASPGRPHSTFTLILLGIIALIVFATTCAMGVWQIQRLAWKENLISQVNTRIHLPAVPAPSPAEWSSLNDANAEYRHITATGEYQFDKQTLVQTVTDLGGGYWVLTPMQLTDGSTVLVNRGFVLPQWRKTQTAEKMPSGPTQVTGLLRMSEPGTAFLRNNEPATDRWYTRDLPTIARVRGLGEVAPYSIDVDAASSGNNQDPTIGPVGGLTMITFANSHLSYAITWFVMAAMVLVGVVIVVRDERRRRAYARRNG